VVGLGVCVQVFKGNVEFIFADQRVFPKIGGIYFFIFQNK